MNYSSKLLANAVEKMALLPGIGHKTALRLVLHLLKQPKEQTKHLTNALENLLEKVMLCGDCYGLSDTPICNICADNSRDKKTICVVEHITDVMAIESTRQYRGVYHVLGGKISPMEGISPEDLQLESLKKRVFEGEIKELILALSATMEGDTTNFYIYKMLKEKNMMISCIAKGISVGNELQYTDEVTLWRSILHRIPFSKT